MTLHDTDVVSSLRLAIARQMTQDRFDLWFADADVELDEGEKIVRVWAAHNLAVDWLRTNVRTEVQLACDEVVGPEFAVHYGVKAQGQALGKRRAAVETNLTSDTRMVEVVRPRPTQGGAPAHDTRRRFACFDDFVTGACNKVASTSAQIVASRPGETSPFFVYGPTGVGKSHLLESILTDVRRSPSRRGGHRRCVHLSSEQFTHGFVQSLRGQGLPSFRRRHREVDLLVIEDVHFLEGKRATISELVHTIDSVTNDGGQLAFSSQFPPSELGGLGDELVNRFCGGLVIEMRPVDRPTREVIVRSLATKKGLSLTDAVVELIADQVLGDVRKLQGAINQLSAQHEAFGGEITEAVAQESLKPYFSSAPKNLSLRDIERAVCDEFDLEPRKLKSDSRRQRISSPRMLAMFLARKYTRAALSEIGDHFGRRSHSSVVAAEKKMRRLINEGSPVAMADKQCTIDEAVRRVEQRLRAS